jgi:siroheme synthase-like protein
MRGLAGLVSLEERPYRRGEVAGYRLAVAATGDPAVNRAVFEDGEEAGVWVNSADDPASCSFILPAVARQGPVSVAISTSGYSPALASWLKSHVAENMGPELAELAGMLADARARLKATGRSTEDVDWRRGIDWAMLDLIRSGRRAEAKERLEACLSQ